ncbi:hypothetical protein [Sphingomonas sp. CFBP9021]|uniref:hypothetical protein n=1 Tax=Sphingomonas sp. CFBP9021 TaxID=3096534 RepID=UPI002A6B896F|nr:hypothetical protein [Sphingomonas sp. CFBP9021]MDY0969139.1 hypothetical protein [Sphingomonas sp. CFBP9021]
MGSRQLSIAGTSYSKIDVWNGEYHDVAVRFRKTTTLVRDRGYVHVCAQNAGGFSATRRLTLARAMRGKWHRFDIKRRDLARRFLIEIEPLVALGVVDLKFDGGRVRTDG